MERELDLKCKAVHQRAWAPHGRLVEALRESPGGPARTWINRPKHTGLGGYNARRCRPGLRGGHVKWTLSQGCPVTWEVVPFLARFLLA